MYLSYVLLIMRGCIADRGHADEVRDACMGVALKIGGWDKEGKVKNGDFKRTQRARAAAC